MSVLITGGTGFFGRSFVDVVRREALFRRICVFSRNEAAQAAMRERFSGDDMRYFIGDVRDRSRLSRAMRGVRVVIHAAALKRIEVGRYNPTEMVRTNIDGTINVIEAAEEAGAEVVVLISSDKAFQPISAYGHSKAMAEALFVAANDMVAHNGPRYVVVRYGNVFGSTGSVFVRWRDMIAAGETVVPVTDPDCTRFYMTASEAVALVNGAIASAREGKKQTMFVPELPAYRVADLAEALGVGIRITGLPDWEKRHESMGDGNSSDVARRMTVDEIRGAIREFELV
jgi:UDP-N-acetylglucosamine 4,6-dehydratase